MAYGAIRLKFGLNGKGNQADAARFSCRYDGADAACPSHFRVCGAGIACGRYPGRSMSGWGRFGMKRGALCRAQ
jgi:hypothetical protein